MTDINLIPKSEKQAQVKQKVVKSSTTLSVVVFVIAALIGGYMFYQALTIKTTIKTHEAGIEALRGDIRGLADIEITARNLGQRYETLNELLMARNNYSTLLTEFEKRVPESVMIDTFGLGRENTINVSGTGIDYIAIARFINDLSDETFEDSTEGLGGLFTDVALNSVNLDAQTNKARFFIVVSVEEALLK